jgi:multidrug resistance efflux pump
MSILKNIRPPIDASASNDPSVSRDFADAVRGLHQRLKRELGALSPASAPAAPAAAPPFRRGLKIVAGVVVVLGFGLQPMLKLLQTGSAEAVVNAPLLNLRAPIDGVVLLDGVSLVLEDPRADSARMDEAERVLARANEERHSLERRRAAALEALARNETQTDVFRKGRILQLEARISEWTHRAAMDEVRVEDAAARVDRDARLAGKVVSALEVDTARRALEVAKQQVLAARAQIDQTRIELDAARSGSFLGDAYNDQPSSAQRMDDLRRLVAELDANIASSDEAMARLRLDLEAERAKFERVAKAVVSPPPQGRIWERLVSPGESVRRGQDLARYVDCSRVVVTAAVDEPTYNALVIGQKARFLAADGVSFDGQVVNLTGPSGASANLAIASSALTKAAFRVSVSLPSSIDACGIGRTGRLVFSAGR